MDLTLRNIIIIKITGIESDSLGKLNQSICEGGGQLSLIGIDAFCILRRGIWKIILNARGKVQKPRTP